MLFGHSPYSWITKKYEHLDEIERGEKTDIELRQTIFDGKNPIEFDENYKDLAILDIVKASFISLNKPILFETQMTRSLNLTV